MVFVEGTENGVRTKMNRTRKGRDELTSNGHGGDILVRRFSSSREQSQAPELGSDNDGPGHPNIESACPDIAF